MSRKIIVAAVLTLVSAVALADDGPTISLTQTQSPVALWRLFPTSNMYTFIELNTQNGTMFKLQWGLSDGMRYQVPICGLCNEAKEAPGARPGRFTLYPTENIYQFILLDQVTGEAWQVQWTDKGTVIPLVVIPYSALVSPSSEQSSHGAAPPAHGPPPPDLQSLSPPGNR